MIISPAPDDALRPALAELVYTSFAEYYARLPVEREQALDWLAAQLWVTNTETEICRYALANGQPVGVWCGYASAQVLLRQMASSQAFARRLPAERRRTFMTELAAFARQSPPLPDNSWYLSRLCVAPSAQGSGLASRLIQSFAGHAAGCSCLSTHVRADNARGRAFYARQGFRPYGESSLYLSLVKDV